MIALAPKTVFTADTKAFEPSRPNSIGAVVTSPRPRRFVSSVGTFSVFSVSPANNSQNVFRPDVSDAHCDHHHFAGKCDSINNTPTAAFQMYPQMESSRLRMYRLRRRRMLKRKPGESAWCGRFARHHTIPKGRMLLPGSTARSIADSMHNPGNHWRHSVIVARSDKLSGA